eukprot:COSAG05_NODE_40_length_27088_cov_92.858276_6_plen_76_part_00
MPEYPPGWGLLPPPGMGGAAAERSTGTRPGSSVMERPSASKEHRKGLRLSAATRRELWLCCRLRFASTAALARLR